jgi:hypothetical protein
MLGLGDLSFLGRLPRVSAAEAQGDPKVVRLHPEIEGTVRLLEETPREKLLEEVAARIRRGLSYREVLAALQLAGVRNVQPRPSVGFKFHSVLVVNSAHLASMSSPDEHRWLPIFWALDYFKDTQAADQREGNWTMAPVDESAVPPAHKARQAFIDAMDKWDEAAADAAVASLARHSTADEVYELFYRYGSRDFRSIGHKAIFVANSRRTLDAIGWHHAEPILRSLSYALLNREGGASPAESDLPADRPGRRNAELAQQLKDNWLSGKLEDSATSEMLAVFRQADDAEACKQTVELINRGVSPQSIWDALFVAAGELLMRQPGIVPLHAVTSTNALRYAFNATSDDASRRQIMLQNVAFVTLFREAAKGRGKLKDGRLDTLETAKLNSGGEAAVEEIFADVGDNTDAAAQKVLAYLEQGEDPKQLLDAARVLIFLKGTNSHDYKFSSAALEDFYNVSPAWRNRFLASSVFNLRGSQARDNRLVARTRAALA